jgi:hypothetical protein
MFKSENIISAMSKVLSYDWVTSSAEADRVITPAAATSKDVVDLAIAVAQAHAHPQLKIEEDLSTAENIDEFCQTLVNTATDYPDDLAGVDVLVQLKMAIKKALTAIPGAAQIFIKVCDVL